jgi:hypothetical protein
MDVSAAGENQNRRPPGHTHTAFCFDSLAWFSAVAVAQASKQTERAQTATGAPMLDSLGGHHGQQQPVQQLLETQQAVPSPRAPRVRSRAPAVSPRVRVLVGSSKLWRQEFNVLQQSPTCAKLRTDANTVHSNRPYHPSGTPTEAELQLHVRAMSTMWHHVLAVPHLPIDDALASSPSGLALQARQVGQAAGQVTWQNAQKDEQWLPDPDDARRLRQSVRSRVAAAARAGHPLFWSANAEDVEDEHGDKEERREESPRPSLSPTSPRAHSSFRPIRAPSSPASHLSSPSTQRGATPPWGWQNTGRIQIDSRGTCSRSIGQPALQLPVPAAPSSNGLLAHRPLIGRRSLLMSLLGPPPLALAAPPLAPTNPGR